MPDPALDALRALGTTLDPPMAVVRLLYLMHATPTVGVRPLYVGLRKRWATEGNEIHRTSYAWSALHALVPELGPDALHDGVVLSALSKLASIQLSYDDDTRSTLGTVFERLLSVQERRTTGAHFTPRTLAAPIVKTTLRPLLEVIGESPTAAQLLAVRVCDPAVGGCAFLIEVVRYLGDLVHEAWQRDGSTATLLEARRQVAQQCVYGVDKNIRAVEVSRMSLRLSTKQADPDLYTTTIKHGDALVGLTLQQIRGFTWNKNPTTVVDIPVRHLRLVGDLVIGAFFANSNKKAREIERLRRLGLVKAWLRSGAQDPPIELTTMVAALRAEQVPFHWELEFPEVFT